MLAIVNGKVLTMTGKEYARGMVLINGGKIAGVGPAVTVPEGTEIIDADGKVVMPGLVDAHCHLGINEEIYRWEGDDLNEFTQPVTPHLRAIDAINPMDEGFRDALIGGVTTVCTGPGSANVIGGENLVMKTFGRVVDQMAVRHPAGVKIAFGENPKRIHGDRKQMPSTRMGAAALLREQLVQAENYRRALGRSVGVDGSKERDLKMEALVRVLERRLPFHAHAHRADDIMTAVRIAEEFGVDLIIAHCTEGHLIVEELARRNFPVIVGPSLTNRAKVEMKERTFQTPGILAAAGIQVALMTDHPVVPIQYLALCAALAVKEGMTEEDALKAITINPARLLGVGGRLGSLEDGKDADIIILNGSPLELKTRVEMVL
ncbi:MAG: amidohydrolase, partial [Bacillota bacterium]